MTYQTEYECKTRAEVHAENNKHFLERHCYDAIIDIQEGELKYRYEKCLNEDRCDEYVDCWIIVMEKSYRVIVKLFNKQKGEGKKEVNGTLVNCKFSESLIICISKVINELKMKNNK